MHEKGKVTIMQVMEHAQKVPFDDISKMLIEFSWETIWARSFIMFHGENCISNLLFGEWSREEFIFCHTNLRNIIHPIT